MAGIQGIAGISLPKNLLLLASGVRLYQISTWPTATQQQRRQLTLISQYDINSGSLDV